MQVGKFATLYVKALEPQGAQLSWGKHRLIFLPREEFQGPLQVGDEVVVFITQDSELRPMASMQLEDFIDKDASSLKVDQRVDLLVFAETKLGYKAIIDHRFVGVLYSDEVFQPVYYGQRLPGYVKKIRDDGKIDLILQPSGNKGSSDLGFQILAEIEARRGFLNISEKDAPELIYELFGISKKKYKLALSSLYKKRLVTLHPDGVRLVRKD